MEPSVNWPELAGECATYIKLVTKAYGEKAAVVYDQLEDPVRNPSTVGNYTNKNERAALGGQLL